jgi:hypothetical protein
MKAKPVRIGRVVCFASLAFATSSASSCGSESLAPVAMCSPSRRIDESHCCDPWFLANDERTCVARAWSDAHAFGAPGLLAANLASAVDGSGSWILAWTHDGRLVVAEDASGTIEVDEGLIDALPGSSSWVDVCAGPEGEALLAWRQTGFDGLPGDANAIFVAQRAPLGKFSIRSTPVSFGANAYQPRIAIGPAGDTVLVWNQWYGEHFGVSLATARRAHEPLELPRSEDDVLSFPINFSNAPWPAVARDGGFLVSWFQSFGSELLVYVSEREGRDGSPSRPSPPDAISPLGAATEDPRPAIGPHNEAAVVWSGDPGLSTGAVYLATRDVDGNWTSPLHLGDSLSPRNGLARSAHARFGVMGDLWVVWEQDTRIVAAYRDPSGHWQTSFARPLELSTSGREALEPAIAAGNDGGLLVVFTEQDDTGRFVVVARRLVSGRFEAGPREVLSAPDDGNAYTPVVSIGGPDDRAVVAWTTGDINPELRLRTLD